MKVHAMTKTIQPKIRRNVRDSLRSMKIKHFTSHLISLMYTLAGASFNPNIKLSEKNAMQIIQNVSAMNSVENMAIAGIITSINAFRRPSASDKKKLRKLPNGWPINVKLAGNTNLIKFKNFAFCVDDAL